jgi:NAD(P)-dependent dehydrogenase (short-subunit alcohol dehydrogenase family)
MLGCREMRATPLLRLSGDGVIVNVSSIAGRGRNRFCRRRHL